MSHLRARLVAGRRLLPPLVFLAVALVVAAPMLRPGHVLLLDHALDVHRGGALDLWNRSLSLEADLPLDVAIWLGVQALGSQLLDRVWFVGMIAAAGWGGYALAAGSPPPFRYVAGLLVAVNPWVYDRIGAGHWPVLLAYALTPWQLRAWVAWSSDWRWRRVPQVALLSTLTVGVSLPRGLIAAMGSTVLTAPRFVRVGKARLTAVASQYALIALAGVMTQLHWLGLEGGTQRLESIGSADLKAFATVPDPTFGLYFNVAALYGFWREPSPLPGAGVGKWDLPLWWLLPLAVVATALLGAWRLSRSSEAHERSQGVGFLALGIFAFLFALGDQGPTGPLFEWLYDRLPGFNGFREPQKAVGLLAISYAALGAAGLAALGERFGSRRPWVAPSVLAGAALWVVLLIGHRQLSAQDPFLRPVSFPDSWHEVSEVLNDDPGDFQVLVLPWHQYLSLEFAGPRVLANPARAFFKVPVIAGDNVELPDFYSESTSPRSAYIEALLDARDRIGQLGNLLVPLGVKYVVLLREVDYRAYGFLSQQADLELVATWPELELYRNLRFAGRVYPVAETVSDVPVDTLIEDLGTSVDFSRRAPILGVRAEAAPATVMSFEMTGAGVRVEVAEPGWLVFTDTYDARLELDGKRPALAYGSVNAYRVDAPGSFVIEPPDAHRTWALRAISFASVVVLLALLASPSLLKRISTARRQRWPRGGRPQHR